MNIVEIPRRAGAARSTVFSALSRRRSVSLQTKALIQAVIHEIGYRPNGAARALEEGRTHCSRRSSHCEIAPTPHPLIQRHRPGTSRRAPLAICAALGSSRELEAPRPLPPESGLHRPPGSGPPARPGTRTPANAVRPAIRDHPRPSQRHSGPPRRQGHHHPGDRPAELTTRAGNHRQHRPPDYVLAATFGNPLPRNRRLEPARTTPLG